jgi:ribose 5-phosphate isomerase RpiB
MVQTFLNTPFAGGRHQRRLDKITAIEEEEHDRAIPLRTGSTST